MTAQARGAVGGDRLPVLLHDEHRIVGMATDAANCARDRGRRMAVDAGRGAVRPVADCKAQVVVGGGGRRLQRARRGADQPVRRNPRDRPVAEAAVARERRGGDGPYVNGEDARPAVVLFVASVAVNRSVGELLLAGAKVTLRAVGEDVHAGERKARPSMDDERLGDSPTGWRVTVVAGAQQASAVEVVVAARAVALDGLCTGMASSARRVHVLAGQREARGIVIELHRTSGSVQRLP